MNRSKSRPVAGSSRSSSSWRAVKGGVTAPQGYLAAGVAAGIKTKGLDLALLFSSQPASGAAVFTTNLLQAAPVMVSRNNLKASRGKVRAILVNSGCANACTGKKGVQDALVSIRSVASHLGIEASQVLVASTGVIGSPLPAEKILRGIDLAASGLNSRGGNAASRAIMTTDTCEKQFAFEGFISGKKVRIGGMAKGSGMIHPSLATMLAFITTDAAVSPVDLNRVFRRVIDRTFNCLTVDGDTSTNDMVAVIANGVSGVKIDRRSAPQFERGLEKVCAELAKSVARDGEGASKFIEILVKGARSFSEARQVAKSIAHSPLVKTAICGEELNWGRILCAAGYSGVRFVPETVTLTMNRIPVFRKGSAVLPARAKAEKSLRFSDIQIELDLASGAHSARVWTCDLTHGYIDINASYIS